MSTDDALRSISSPGENSQVDLETAGTARGQKVAASGSDSCQLRPALRAGKCDDQHFRHGQATFDRFSDCRCPSL